MDDMLAQVQQSKRHRRVSCSMTPQLYDEARASIAEAKKMLDDLNAGKGTAGKLLNDEEVYKQLTIDHPKGEHRSWTKSTQAREP